MEEIKRNILQFELATSKAYEVKQQETEEQEDLNFYVEALIATTDKDMVNDVIAPQALEKAAETLKTKYQTVLFNHDKNRPIGKVVDAKVITLDGDENRKGLWVKILISKTETEIWQKIKEGVLSKFSFAAYATKQPVYRKSDEDGSTEEIDYYIITDLDIFECSLVSVPANPNAVALSYYVAKYLENEKDNLIFTEKDGGEIMAQKQEVLKKEEKKKKPKIIINHDDVDFTPWSKVNKVRLRNILFEAGSKTAINEMYGVVRSYERMTDWGYPHHNLISKGENTYEMVLNYNGLMAAYKAMRGARGGGKNLTEQERSKLKAHLRKHFKKLISMGEYDEIPEGLKSLVKLINYYFEIEEKNVDKNLLKKVEEDIEKELNKLEEMEKQLMLEEGMEFKEVDMNLLVEELENEEDTEVELEKTEKQEEIDTLSSQTQVEFTVDDLLKRIKETVLEALKEYFEQVKMEEEDEEDEEDEECDETEKAKNKKKCGKEKKELDSMLEEKETTEKVVLDILSSLEKKLNELEEKVNKLYEQPPVVKGMNAQRDFEEHSLDSLLTTEKFNQLPLRVQLDVLKILMDRNLSEDTKIKKIKNIMMEVSNNG